MVFECTNGTFSGVDTVFMGRNALKVDEIFEKSVLEILGALVIKNMEVGRVSMVEKKFVGVFLSVANAGTLTIGNGHSMEGVSILVVQDEDIVLTPARREGEVTSLVGIGFKDNSLVEKESTNLMGTGFN